MSNKAVAAARRRSAPPQDNIRPPRPPQPSINSSQAFNSQSSTNMTKDSNAVDSKNTKPSSITIPQAIALTTIRLGKLEQKMSNPDTSTIEVINSINSRLSELEQNPNSEIQGESYDDSGIKLAIHQQQSKITTLTKDLKGALNVIESLKQLTTSLNTKITALMLTSECDIEEEVANESIEEEVADE